MSFAEALNRTLLLMRDELSQHVSDEELIEALRTTSVTLIANEKNLKSHSAQSAYVTAAILLARSGHRVHLDAPNVELTGAQPPLGRGKLTDQLDAIGRDILPGISFVLDPPQQPCDLAILFGDTPGSGHAIRSVRLNAAPWQARITPFEVAEPWPANNWPIGGMGAAALGAAEAFKCAMWHLAHAARSSRAFAELFDPTKGATIDLAPPDTPEIPSLNQMDFISAGAINSCALYALLRLPGVSGVARIIEHDTVTLSNLNRGMLFLRSRLNLPKADVVASYELDNFSMLPLVSPFALATYAKLGNLSNAVLVGVDDIRARWDVQRAWPQWLGIGATSHFCSLASFHTSEIACAGCLHPRDDQAEGPVPTVAFVSFWAGLWLLTLYLRHLANDPCMEPEQQIYFTPMRPETVWRSPVERRSDCPVRCRSHGERELRLA